MTLERERSEVKGLEMTHPQLDDIRRSIFHLETKVLVGRRSLSSGRETKGHI